jgi:foldase protein PrsA
MPRVSKKKTVSQKATTAPVASTPSAVSKPYRAYLKNSKVLVIGGILLLAALLYVLRSVFVAATVNGRPVSRLELVRILERQNGKAALESLITKQLIMQEAQNQNVQIEDKEVDNEIKKIEQSVAQQGQNFEELLKAQNLTRDSLKEQIKLEKTIQKIIGKDINVSDEEVNEYIEKNKESFPPDSKVEELREPVREQIQQQRMSEKFQTWLEDLEKKATIYRFVNF